MGGCVASLDLTLPRRRGKTSAWALPSDGRVSGPALCSGSRFPKRRRGCYRRGLAGPAVSSGARRGKPCATCAPRDASALFPDSAAIPSASRRRPSTAWCSLSPSSCSSKSCCCSQPLSYERVSPRPPSCPMLTRALQHLLGNPGIHPEARPCRPLAGGSLGPPPRPPAGEVRALHLGLSRSLRQGPRDGLG